MKHELQGQVDPGSNPTSASISRVTMMALVLSLQALVAGSFGGWEISVPES